MTKRKQFEDPLEDIDPIMMEAFSQPKAPAYSTKPTLAKEPAVEENTQIPEELPHDNTPEIAEIQFPSLTHSPISPRLELDTFSTIPVSVSVELGRSQISLKEVFELAEGSIIELERLVGEPLDLVVNGQIIAQGEVVAIDNNYGLRVTNVIAPSGIS